MAPKDDAVELTSIKADGGVHQTNTVHDPALPTFEKKRLSLGRAGSKVVEKNFFVSFWDQLVIMMRRNTILQIRYRASTIAQTIIAPLVFHLVLYILQQADYANQRINNYHPPIGALDGVQPCQGYGSTNCVFMFYYPQTPEYTTYMNNFAKMNSQRMGSTFTVSNTVLPNGWTPASTDNTVIYPVSSQDYIYNYAINTPNVTRWAVTFDTQKPSASALTNVRYQVWYNATLTANASDIFGRELVSVIRGLDEAIITSLNGNGQQANLDYQLKDWPLIPAVTLSDEIVQALGPCFFFCSVMVIFITVLNQIVGEKEAKLRHGMEMMGLKPCVYWTSQYLSNSLLVLVNSFATSVFGIAFGFSAFKNTNFMVLWITFFLFGESMVMLAFFMTTFVRQARVAVLLGIFVFVIGLLFESFVFSGSFLGYLWWNPDIVADIGWKILILVPFFNFGHMFLDISTYTTGRKDDLTDTFIPGPGFKWETLNQNLPSSLAPIYSSGTAYLPAPIQAWSFMFMNIFIYAALLWYFDAIIPDEYGTRQPLYFFVLPSYWGFSTKSKQADEEWLRRVSAEKALPVEGDVDSDILAERDIALTSTEQFPVRLVNLNKTYAKYPFISSKLDKVAVRNSCLTLQEGKLLALLGQNGAGKSTTMSILAGLTPATSGDALIYGLSVRSQMSLIRKFLGVCPQHDILFDDLTAKEHIELYAGLKGVPTKYWGELFEERLKAVKLWTVKDVRAGTYSGGMKRRLSLVISTIGDPKVIFMDEPTTGMDPVNRRHVWSFVENFKKDRVIVLTTHSMEEADVLGDRIAIMAHGRLRAIGNSISLKNKYGAGYRISVITDFPNEMKGQVNARVPNAKLEDDSAGALIYQFPISSTHAIPGFVKWLEENKDGQVKAWGISQTTLEEVFLKIIRDANPNGYVATQTS
ncbi:ATP-binding cassette sub- A member 1 [Blyttiomyces sp. JEL0837]|nr:ATP-binding cassette sub- A member 1 [Blyttiomyces sp. JEL0837]